MVNLRTMDDIPLDGKRVLVRLDLNVSVGDDGKVDMDEDYRIEASIPTLEELQQRRCKVIIVTHLGRPYGSGPTDLNMQPVLDQLQDLLRDHVRLAPVLYGSGAQAVIDGMQQGEVAMLPNVRSDLRESENDKKFAKSIAELGEAYVNEAFSVCHRAHTSVVGLPEFLPSCAGRRLVLEVAALDKLRVDPEKPYLAIVSGAKIETKVGMLKALADQVDKIFVGGRIANVLFEATGKHEAVKEHKNVLKEAREVAQLLGDKLMLPIDVVIGPEFERDAQGNPSHIKEGDTRQVQTISADNLPDDLNAIWDIGEKTVDMVVEEAKKAKTIMWNGPVGAFEVGPYGNGTRALVNRLAEISTAHRVIGGGDTVKALEQEKVLRQYDHVSVGGGAMVAYLEGVELPGLAPLAVV